MNTSQAMRMRRPVNVRRIATTAALYAVMIIMAFFYLLPVYLLLITGLRQLRRLAPAEGGVADVEHAAQFFRLAVAPQQIAHH